MQKRKKRIRFDLVRVFSIVIALLIMSALIASPAAIAQGDTQSVEHAYDLRESSWFDSGRFSPALFKALQQREHARIPPFMVWTSLGQRDVEACLPRGATVQAQREGGYLVSGVTDAAEFGWNLGMKSTERRADIPRIGRQGTQDPKTISTRIRDAAVKLAQLLHDIIYGRQDAQRKDPFPKGPLPDPETIRQILGPGFDPDKGPPVTGGGKWVAYCEPQAPCVRPLEPNPEDVDDCKKEQAEVDRLLEKVKYWGDQVKGAGDLLTTLELLKTGSDTTEGVVFVISVYAVMTCPLGPAVGLVAVVGTVTVYKIVKELIDFFALDLAIAEVKRQLADLKRIYNGYVRGLNDAYAELRACRKKAAEAAQRNTAAFQKFIDVDLPAYYECLKRRKCGRRWAPK